MVVQRRAVMSPRVAALAIVTAVVAGLIIPAHRAAEATGDTAAPAPANPVPPPGFTARDVRVNGVRVHYVTGGHGPTLVLLHGYPETSYAWFGVMPQLGRHYTIVAPDLRGAGGSSAPPDGYDKVHMAADVHGLLASLGRTQAVNVVGHDIGAMVAFAYAGTYRAEVRRLALTEAPIPGTAVYGYPSLTTQGPGFGNFGFFSLENGLPESAVPGHETQWVAGLQNRLAVNKDAFPPRHTAVYADALRDPAHLRAGFAWFRAFPADNIALAAMGRTKLTMPVLAVGADHSLGASIGRQAREYAEHVQAAVVPGSGHWIWEERPHYMSELLLDFLGS